MNKTLTNNNTRSHEYSEAARSNEERGPRKVPEVREAEPEARGRRVATFWGNVTVGSIATVKVGRNRVEVEILGTEGDKWKVKSISSGREFLTAKLESIKTTGAIPDNTEDTMNEENQNPEAEPIAVAATDAPADSPETEDTPNPAPESGSDKPEKKLGLYEAAVEVLRKSKYPMNTKAIVAKAIERGLWTNTGGKTPEQSLYSSIFREIKTKEKPRIIKSTELRGLFEYNRG